MRRAFTTFLGLAALSATAVAQPRPPRTARPPPPQAPPPEAEPEAPRDPLLRALEPHREAFVACYVDACQARPTLQGTVTLRVVVGTGGRVTQAQATGIDDADAFLQCLVSRVRGQHLEGVISGTAYSVPLDFRPGE